MKVVEDNVTAFREKGVKGSVNSAADAVLTRTDGVVQEAKKLPGFVNKQTEVALDRVEDAFNQVTSYPIGKNPWQLRQYKSDSVQLLFFVLLLSPN